MPRRTSCFRSLWRGTCLHPETQYSPLLRVYDHPPIRVPRPSVRPFAPSNASRGPPAGWLARWLFMPQKSGAHNEGTVAARRSRSEGLSSSSAVSIKCIANSRGVIVRIYASESRLRKAVWILRVGLVKCRRKEDSGVGEFWSSSWLLALLA